MKSALMIIDVQESFIGSRREEKSYAETFEYINATADLSRNAGKPVGADLLSGTFVFT